MGVVLCQAAQVLYSAGLDAGAAGEKMWLRLGWNAWTTFGYGLSCLDEHGEEGAISRLRSTRCSKTNDRRA